MYINNKETYYSTTTVFVLSRSHTTSQNDHLLTYLYIRKYRTLYLFVFFVLFEVTDASSVSFS